MLGAMVDIRSNTAHASRPLACWSRCHSSENMRRSKGFAMFGHSALLLVLLCALPLQGSGARQVATISQSMHAPTFGVVTAPEDPQVRNRSYMLATGGLSASSCLLIRKQPIGYGP